MPLFNISDRVDRIEERATTGAAITAIQENGQETTYELEYDEGGKGWWPETAIKAAAQ